MQRSSMLVEHDAAVAQAEVGAAQRAERIALSNWPYD